MKKLSKVLMLMMAVIGLNAQVWVENFENHTAEGDLEGTNGWYVSLKSSEAMGVSPVIGAQPLTYAGYAGSGVGQVAILDPLMGVDDATKRLSTNKMKLNGADLLAVPGEKIYVAFLASILPQSITSVRDFFTFEGSETSNFSRGRVFANYDSDLNQVFYGVSKNSSGEADISWISEYFYTDAPTLFVVVYEAIEGADNDVVHLYVDPIIGTPEAEQDPAFHAASADVKSDYGDNILGINLRQRGIGAHIGGIRVAKSWDEAVSAGNGTSINDVDAKPSVSIYAANNSVYTSENGNVEIYSVTGNRVFAGFSNGSVSVALQSGLYIVKLTAENGKVYSEKVIVE